ncbi:DUF115 domain-containing protein [Opitutaceae bacterium TAV4]|nr:DUF115 domain-containing protein [Opitutaceae bacterium TAV4]RRJ94496.1 DUF115 domain-containing protein [Opitutaceae bacterium TAV4]RRJ98557.1 DUF115 domain-containing protein [Opitutaceae bacterium TAV3]
MNINSLLRDGDVNNPYKYAIREIISRLRWDISTESRRSRCRLIDLHKKYLGKSAVIVCNGPSLLKTDLPLLSNVYTFGLNKINLLFDKSDFRPSCIVAVNAFVIEQNRDYYNQTDCPLFLDRVAVKQVRHRENVIFLHSSDQAKFARDCSMSIKQGNTVTFVAMQLAFHMGFRHIALVGCDHNFAQKGPANKTVKAEGDDQSHFDPRYFSGGVNWQLPDLAASEHFYSVAGDTFAAAGGSIVNCTEGGKLEVFERASLVSWIGRHCKSEHV